LGTCVLALEMATHCQPTVTLLMTVPEMLTALGGSGSTAYRAPGESG